MRPPPRTRFVPVPILAAVAADLLALGGLTVLVALGIPAAWDDAVNAALAPYRAGAALAIFLWVTAGGTGAALLAVTASVTVLLAAQGNVRLAATGWLVFAGTEATTWSLKFAIARTRPPFIPEVTALSPSFPSAHAAGSAAVYGFVAYAVWRARGRDAGRWHPFAAAGAVVALIGFSRVFLSVHYVTDVIGGWLVALPWLLLGTALAAGPDAKRPGG